MGGIHCSHLYVLSNDFSFSSDESYGDTSEGDFTPDDDGEFTSEGGDLDLQTAEKFQKLDKPVHCGKSVQKKVTPILCYISHQVTYI